MKRPDFVLFFVLACAPVACMHDFDAFDPTDTAGTDATSADASAPRDAAGDAATPVRPDASTGDAAVDCTTKKGCFDTRTTCSNACSTAKNACYDKCNGSNGCRQRCRQDESTCNDACTNACHTCSGPSCTTGCGG